jgi:hypothetical protein
MSVRTAASPTIAELFDAFLDEQEARLAPRTFANYEMVIELFADCLNGYGHDLLSPLERERWEAAFDDGDEDAFVNLFGADKVLANLDGFLGWFMVRKVMAGGDLLKASGTVTKKLVSSLAAQGLIDDQEAAGAAERASDASRDLPKAERLSTLLYEQSERAPLIDPDELADSDWVEDSLFIDRIDGNEIWFERDIGPLKVSATAAKLAQPGWQVTVLMAKHRGTWHLLEVGNVYP